MDHMRELAAANKALTDFLEVETKDRSRFRFSTKDRVDWVRDVQFKEGKEVRARAKRAQEGLLVI